MQRNGPGSTRCCAVWSPTHGAVAPDEIDAERPLADYGLSSRDAVGIAGELEAALGRQLPSTLLWENPNLTALVRALTQDAPELSVADGQALSRSAGVPIAVVGVGCRLPGGAPARRVLGSADGRR